jgi:predicted 3-demethylubiquinone-9 3-methyltransferase (glyoxalase superfamily)
MPALQRITPFLWFDRNAEEAARFYVSIFENSKILGLSRDGTTDPGRNGAVMVVAFQLAGQQFLALNGGPQFAFTEAVSFVVNCDTQDEVDRFWDRLSDGGEKGRCGWLKDRFGLSWQVVPTALGRMLQDRDPARCRRVMESVMQMDKLEIQRLQDAFNAG